MSARTNLNIENKLKIAFSADEAQKAILKVLNDKNLDGDFEIDIKIVDKNEIQKLNKKYRDKDAPTDVLSFPIQDKFDADIKVPVLLGDIIICPAMADNNILELIEHSVLHLLGSHHPGD